MPGQLFHEKIIKFPIVCLPSSSADMHEVTNKIQAQALMDQLESRMRPC